MATVNANQCREWQCYRAIVHNGIYHTDIGDRLKNIKPENAGRKTANDWTGVKRRNVKCRIDLRRGMKMSNETQQLKLGTHCPCPRAVFTGVHNDARAREHGRHSGHPWTRPVILWRRVSKTDSLTPEFTGRVGHQCIQHGPWTRPVDTVRGHGYSVYRA